jgi:hypothetical protein
MGLTPTRCSIGESSIGRAAWTQLQSWCQAELDSRTTEIENLKLLVLKLKRMHFGPRSEKSDQDIKQLELRLEDLEAN